MKDLIAVAEKDKENKELLPMKNKDKTAMAEVVIVLSTINLGSIQIGQLVMLTWMQLEI